MKNRSHGQFFHVEFRLLALSVMKRTRQLPILSRIEEHLRQQLLLKWPFQLEMSCLKGYWIENVPFIIPYPIK